MALFGFDVSTFDWQPLLQAFLAHYQFIVPSIIACQFVEPAMLKHWLAVQQSDDLPVTTAPPPTTEGEKPSRAYRIMVGIAGVLGYLYFILQLSPESGRVIAFIPVFLISFISLCDIYSSWNDFLKPAVFRNVKGEPVSVTTNFDEITRVHKWNPTAMIKSTAFFVGVFGLLIQEFAQISHVLCGAAIMFLQIRRLGVNFSTRTYFLRATVIVLVLVVTLVLVRFLPDPNQDGNFFQQTLESLIQATPDWWTWVFPACAFVLPGTLIAAALRLDYRHRFASLPQLPEGGDKKTLETVPKPESYKTPDGSPLRRHDVIGETGILIPTSLPPFAALNASIAHLLWCLTCGAFVLLEAWDLFIFRNNTVFAACALVVSVPLMCAALSAVACLRGDFARFWTYSEMWNMPVRENTGSEEMVPIMAAEGVEV